MSEELRQPMPATLHRAWADDLTTAQLYALLRLRVEVFVIEQECLYQELDGLDLKQGTRHFWVDSPNPDDGPMACVRLLPEDETTFRIGRMCVAESARGRGIARRLAEATLAEVADYDCVLDAHVEAAELYAQFGFQRVGEEFVEDGVPHVAMRRGSRRAKS
jgi:ElaA protein